jgi:hypothetical protein
MTKETTNTVEPAYRSPDDLLKAVEAFTKGPKLIGNLMGLLVYVDDSVPPGEIEIRHTDGRNQRFSIDHPYIQGTKLEAEARRAFAEHMRPEEK